MNDIKYAHIVAQITALTIEMNNQDWITVHVDHTNPHNSKYPYIFTLFIKNEFKVGIGWNFVHGLWYIYGSDPAIDGIDIDYHVYIGDDMVDCNTSLTSLDIPFDVEHLISYAIPFDTVDKYIYKHYKE